MLAIWGLPFPVAFDLTLRRRRLFFLSFLEPFVASIIMTNEEPETGHGARKYLAAKVPPSPLRFCLRQKNRKKGSGISSRRKALGEEAARRARDEEK